MFGFQKHLPNSPRIADLMYNLGGLLVNSHEVLEYPMLLPSTYHLIGGMHIVEREKEDRKKNPITKVL